MFCFSTKPDVILKSSSGRTLDGFRVWLLQSPERTLTLLEEDRGLNIGFDHVLHDLFAHAYLKQP